MVNPNVLSQRYATPAMNEIWSERNKILAERELWIEVMKAQRQLGMDIPAEDIEKFEKAKNEIDLEEIERIERVTKHDIKAKIQAFVKVAGAGEHLHKGMTSRDLSDNVEQMQANEASELLRCKYVSVLRHLADKAMEYGGVVLTARTHHQAAQPTLLGRRFAMWGEELYHHLAGFESFIDGLPLRGIKGAVGTQFDMLTLLGSKENVAHLERTVAASLGFAKVQNAPGQVYPRSFDYALVSNLALLGAGCENFAKGMRLMAGYDLVTEGFKEGQVGSTAMPHKMNTRSSERICGLAELLKMYADGASRLSGDQWEEGDVSCSVVRRIVIPDSFYVSDGLCETTLTVLNQMGSYPAVIDAETERYLPFLATTEILMAAVQAGIGREAAHKIIKQHSVTSALRMRQGGSDHNDLPELLASEPVFRAKGITKNRIDSILSDKAHFVGNAYGQITAFRDKVYEKVRDYGNSAMYEPGDIL